MVQILRSYEENGWVITEFTKDGETISHTISHPISQRSDPMESPIPQTTIEEQILAETQYQTALMEMNTMGGI